MAFHTEVDLKSKKSGGKDYIIAMLVNTERKFKIKAKRKSA